MAPKVCFLIWQEMRFSQHKHGQQVNLPPLLVCPPTCLVPQCAGPVTMVLDFGRFVFDSNAAALAHLTEEEAAVYMPFQLAGRDLSAYLVDGDFSWSYMEEKRLTALLAEGGAVAGAVVCAFMMWEPP
jgi:hypothetical protein